MQLNRAFFIGSRLVATIPQFFKPRQLLTQKFNMAKEEFRKLQETRRINIPFKIGMVLMSDGTHRLVGDYRQLFNDKSTSVPSVKYKFFII